MKLFNNKDDNEDAIEVINSTNPSDMDNNIQKSSNLNISFSDIICYIFVIIKDVFLFLIQVALFILSFIINVGLFFLGFFL